MIGVMVEKGELVNERGYGGERWVSLLEGIWLRKMG